MVRVWNIEIPELSGKKKRRAYVYLPKVYFEDHEVRLPVLYMFDGHNVFFDDHATYGKSWGMKDYMDQEEIPMIVAAVECNDGRNNERLSEYSPYNFEFAPFGKINGKGKTTMDWLVKTFKAYMDENYRTLPDREHTYIAGSSMGGLMSLYAITAYNEYFGKAAALSPSITFSKEKLEKLFRTSRIRKDTLLYMDYGQTEMKEHPGMMEMFSKTTALLMERGILVESRIVPGGIHSEASWEKQLPFIMGALLYK